MARAPRSTQDAMRSRVRRLAPEIESEPDVGLEVLGRDLHRSLAELLRDVEALEVAHPGLDREPVANVPVHPDREVVAEAELVLAAQALADLLLAVGVVRHHDIGADSVVDQRDMGADVRPDETVSLGTETSSEIEAEVGLVGLLLDAQPGDLIPELAVLVQEVGPF